MSHKTVYVTLITLLALLLSVGGAIAQQPEGDAPPEPPDLQQPEGQLQAEDITIQAEVNSKISYQGVLKENGSPVTGSRNMVFELHNSSICVSESPPTITKNGVPVNEGVFGVELEVDQFLFDGQEMYLRVQVEGDIIINCQEILTVPYALSLKPGAQIIGNQGSGNAIYAYNTASSGSGVYGRGLYGVYGYSSTAGGLGVYGVAAAASGTTYGVYGQSNSILGTGVYGSGHYGVYGTSSSSGARGVYGEATTASGVTYGVYGQSNSGNGRGVYGNATATSGATYGVYGQSNSSSGYGVYGQVNATSGLNHGVYGSSSSSSGRGVFGYVGAPSGTTYGVYGRSNSSSGRGVFGQAVASSGLNYGVHGQSNSSSGRGVFGEASATSGTTYGVLGQSYSSAGRGVFGNVLAASGTTYGVHGKSNSSSGTGVYGETTATSGFTSGVYGTSSSSSGRGVHGEATATSGETYGVLGRTLSPNGAGVYGIAANTSPGSKPYGVFGYTNWRDGAAIKARNAWILQNGNIIEAYGSSNTNIKFKVTQLGHVYADGNYYGAGGVFAGGADIAERMNASEILEPGDVVEIDPANPGQFRKALAPYSTLAAGVVSTDPAIALANNLDPVTESFDDERPLLALAGRVPMKVSAENGAIQVGDLLTTSATPGHAMRCAQPVDCVGAVVGKALEALDSGTGVIETLVTLQ